jgi:hypothetical protein
MNESSMKFIQETLAHQSRNRFLNTSAKLLCPLCGEVRPVRDVFPNCEAKLEICGHRRPLAYRRCEDVAAYDAAVAAEKQRTAGVPVDEAA